MPQSRSPAARPMPGAVAVPDARRARARADATHRELERAFVRGATPDLDALVGWEFRGINHPATLPVAQVAGIKKFVKGFFRDEDGA